MNILLRINTWLLSLLVIGLFIISKGVSPINPMWHAYSSPFWYAISRELLAIIIIWWVFSIGKLSKGKIILNKTLNAIFNTLFVAGIIGYSLFAIQLFAKNENPLLLIFSGLGVFSYYICYFLMTFWAAKNIRTLELKREANFLEYWYYAIPMILIILGILFYQSKVNELYKESLTTE